MSIEELKSQVKELEDELFRYKNDGKREKIEKMSDEVIDSNPYSRLVSHLFTFFLYRTF